jgi:hypothetical protein
MTATIINFSRQQSKPHPAIEREIARLREIVAETTDSLIFGGGSSHPDAALFDLCAEALHLLAHAEVARAALSATRGEKYDRLWKEYDGGVKRAKPLLSRIRKLRAVTGAGIYAKALVVRTSRTGAPELAKSMAEDLIACAGLRAILWPAERAAQAPEARP